MLKLETKLENLIRDISSTSIKKTNLMSKLIEIPNCFYQHNYTFITKKPNLLNVPTVFSLCSLPISFLFFPKAIIAFYISFIFSYLFMYINSVFMINSYNNSKEVRYTLRRIGINQRAYVHPKSVMLLYKFSYLENRERISKRKANKVIQKLINKYNDKKIKLTDIKSDDLKRVIISNSEEIKQFKKTLSLVICEKNKILKDKIDDTEIMSKVNTKLHFFDAVFSYVNAYDKDFRNFYKLVEILKLSVPLDIHLAKLSNASYKELIYNEDYLNLLNSFEKSFEEIKNNVNKLTSVENYQLKENLNLHVYL